MSRHWATTKEAGVLNGMRFMIWINSIIGRFAFNVVLVFVMSYFFIRRGDARRSSLEYLRRVRSHYPDSLGKAPLIWLSFRQFFTFGQSILDKYLAWVETPDGIAMDPDEEKMLFDAAATDQGHLLIGSHFGNLEYSRGIAHRHPGITINVLIYDQHAQKFAALIEQGEPESRLNLIQVTDIDLELAFKLKEKVKNGEWVVIAGDRVPVGDDGRTCDALFFGEKTRFPIGPYVLATLLQCPVILLHCFRLQDHYHLGVESFAEEINPAREERDAIYEKYAQKFATALEKQVARAPLQWFNFFDFWDNPDSSNDKN
jgi:predicted LPLAT superfamily acyltransferase